MALPLWLHACTIWYVGSNFVMAYKSWPVLPTFFAACYSAGLFGGLGDHLEPYVPQEYHAYTTHIMENYIGRFPLALSILAILLRFCTLDSVSTSLAKKLGTVGLLVTALSVLQLHKPGAYNTDLCWHVVHSTVVHGCLLAANLLIFDCIGRHNRLKEQEGHEAAKEK